MLYIKVLKLTLITATRDRKFVYIPFDKIERLQTMRPFVHDNPKIGKLSQGSLIYTPTSTMTVHESAEDILKLMPNTVVVDVGGPTYFSDEKAKKIWEVYPRSVGRRAPNDSE